MLTLSLGLILESKNVFDTIFLGFFLNDFCFSIGSAAKFLHSFEQHPLSFLEHVLHWIKRIWQASFLQSVWLSQGTLQIWHLERISSVTLSPSLSSNTKFFPLNFDFNPFSFTSWAYWIIPPWSWLTFLKPFLIR